MLMRSTPVAVGEVLTRLGASYRTKIYPSTDLSEDIAQDSDALLNAGITWLDEPEVRAALDAFLAAHRG